MATSRVGDAIERRALELDLNLLDVARGAQMSQSNLFRIRRGDIAITAISAKRLEEALKWEYGSIAAIEAGGEPTPVETASGASDEDLDAALAEISTLNERAAALREEADAIMKTAAVLERKLSAGRRNPRRSA